MPDVIYTKENLPTTSKEELDVLNKLEDKDIDVSDIPPLTKEFFAAAHRGLRNQQTSRADAKTKPRLILD